MSNYKLQVATPDLWKRVCMFHAQFGGLPIAFDTTFMDWKYQRNPYLREPLLYLALHKDQIVGMRGVYGTCWEAAGSPGRRVLPSFTDTIIDESHRNSGLFEDLTDYAMDDMRSRGFSHVLNLSPNPSNYVVSVMTMGWHTIGSAKEMVLGAHRPGPTGTREPPAETMPRRMEKIRNIGIDAGIKLKQAMRINVYRNLERNVLDGKTPLKISNAPRPQAMTDLIEQIGGEGRLRHIRDRAYLSWRYGNPRFRYRFLFWGGKEIDGYMVLQNTMGRRQVNIVDWEGRDPKTLSAMLEAVLNLGQFRTMAAWRGCLPASAKEVLQKAGFNDGQDGSFLGRAILKPLNSDAGKENLLGCDDNQ